MSRLTLVVAALVLLARDGASAPAMSLRVADGLVAEVVATGIVRPIQVAFESDGRLVVLSHGRSDDAAGEIVRVDVRAPLPVDASPLPRVVIPFAPGRRIVLGSLAVDPGGGDLLVGEENGNRVYRLTRDERLLAVAVGLHHLVGGSGMVLDARRRLVVLDFVSPETQLRLESPAPPALDSLSGDGYQGPLVFRVELDPAASLPRRLDLVPPLFPKGWVRPRGDLHGRFMSVAAPPGDGLAVLESQGDLFVLESGGGLRRVARLPSGHFHRTCMILAADGSLLVSTGFHVRRIYRVTPAGVVSVVASELGDPGGIALDRHGHLYVAETAHHRIVRIRPNGTGATRPPPSRP